MSEEIVIYQQPGALVRRDPRQVLAEAGEAARALKDVLEAPGRKRLVMGGETYLEIQDWTTVGHFYGLVPSLVEDGYVEYGGAHGWEATAALRRITDGVEVSRASAMCLDDEDNWSSRPKYEWHYVTKTLGNVRDDPGREELIWEEIQGKRRPKKVKVRVEDEKVPQHQLRSMAQTRANAKVLANVLRYVPVLAGYKGTPAEEMSGARWEADYRDEGGPVGADASPGAPPSTQEPRQRKQRAKADPPPVQETVPPAQAAQAPPPSTRTREEWSALLRTAAESGLDEASVTHHMRLVYSCNFRELDDAQAAELLVWARGPRPGGGFESDHFVTRDRLETPAGVKAAPPATVGEVLARHGIGQPAQQAIDVQAIERQGGAVVSEEVLRQVRNLEKWAKMAGRGLDDVKGASMAAFGMGVEAVLHRYGKAGYNTLMEWCSEDDPKVDRDKILERAALDIKEGRTPA